MKFTADYLLGKVFRVTTTVPAPPHGFVQSHTLATVTVVDPEAGTIRLFDHKTRQSGVGKIGDFIHGFHAGAVEESEVAPYAAWGGF